MGIVGTAVKIANKVTKGLKLQAEVTHRAFNNDAGKGDPVYASPVKRRAVVERKQRMVTGFDGILTKSSHTVTFLEPGIVIKEFDTIVLADGSGGKVVGAGGFVDGATSVQALTEAYL